MRSGTRERTLAPTDAAVQGCLREAMVAELATCSARGRPFVTPLWFVVDGGALYLTTGAETWAARNVARHSDVTLLFHAERGQRPDRILRLRGKATRHRGLPSWRVLLRVAAKYYLSPGALRIELRNARRWRLRRLLYREAKGGFGYVRVVPTTGELLARP
jgi:Pyridoxamine 5'-phosphate oxidase